jgi:hypothetical protein
MTRDRRRQGRSELGRRDSIRVSDYREVFWREVGRGASRRFAWIVDQSARGFAMLMENPYTPDTGSTIAVAIHPQHRERFDLAIVTRTQRLSSALDLVSAEYSGPASSEVNAD